MIRGWAPLIAYAWTLPGAARVVGQTRQIRLTLVWGKVSQHSHACNAGRFWSLDAVANTLVATSIAEIACVSAMKAVC